MPMSTHGDMGRNKERVFIFEPFRDDVRVFEIKESEFLLVSEFEKCGKVIADPKEMILI